MTCDIEIRMATESDATALLEIYRGYVQNTFISFEYDVPSLKEFTERITNTLKKYPYLVAIKNDQIIGYAYVSEFKKRAAYDLDVETSIYIKVDQKRSGVGKALYNSLEEILKQQNIVNLYACISCDSDSDTIIANDSIKFHTAMGYKLVGHFKNCGYKFSKWHDVVYMVKTINQPINELKIFKTINELILK